MRTISVPIGVSNRHLHLSAKDITALFGEDHSLIKKKDLSQPGQFASEETVTLVGPKGNLPGIRVLGPARSESQIELSMTDAIKLGLRPPVRDSANLIDTPGVDIVVGDKKITLERGVILAQRHLHASDVDATKYGLKDQDLVKIMVDGPRGGMFHNVLVRVSPKYALDLHIDTDEANAFGVKDGDIAVIIMEN